MNPAVLSLRDEEASTHQDDVAKVNKSLDALVKEHWILPEDARELRTEAATANVP